MKTGKYSGSGGKVTRKPAIVYLAWFLILLFSLSAIWILYKEGGKKEKTVSMTPSELVSRAIFFEKGGDIVRALEMYRLAIEREPSLCDPHSGDYLGKDFENKVDRWVRELKSGKVSGSGGALKDASFIFRKLHGGCG